VAAQGDPGAQPSFVIRQRGRPQASAEVWTLRVVLLIVLPLLVAVGVGVGIWLYMRNAEPKVAPAGYREYMTLREKVGGVSETLGLGSNNEHAKHVVELVAMELDRQVGEQLKRLAIGTSAAKGKKVRGYGLWCELTDQECMFFMRVPKLEELTAGTQTAIAQSLWDSVQETLKGMEEVKADFPLIISLDETGAPVQLWKGRCPSGAQPPQASPPSQKFKGAEAEQFMIDRFTPGGNLPMPGRK